jgi:hypothetical protein
MGAGAMSNLVKFAGFTLLLGGAATNAVFANAWQMDQAAARPPVESSPNSALGQQQKQRRSPFTPAEDAQLRALMQNFPGWGVIAGYLPGKNARQCRERWINYLDPSVNNALWTQAEDDLLLSLYKTLGSQWVRLEQFFQGRPAAHIKNRWHVLQGLSQGKKPRQRRSKLLQPRGGCANDGTPLGDGDTTFGDDDTTLGGNDRQFYWGVPLDWD